MKLRILAAALLCVALNHAPALGQTTLLPLGLQCFQATTGLNGMVGTLGTVVGGTGGTSGTFGGVALTGGSGSGATANITVAGGAVTAVTILNPGTQFVVGDVLSAAAGTIGGVTGFSVPVNSVTINSSLAGGTVGYYVPNQLTFKTTWKNSTQSVSNTNPVRLDQNGCATVYGIGSYRQIVKDSLGNTVWDALTASTAALSVNPASSGAGDFLAIGTVLPNAGFSAPTNYVLTYGQTISRTTFPDALAALTISSTASCVSTNTTLSGISSTAQMRVGAPVEGSCVAPGTTIASIAGPTSIVLSIAATSTTSTTIKIFNWGNGDGSTTFNVPDFRGRFLPGADAMGGTPISRLTATYYGVSATPPGAASTSPSGQSQFLAAGNLPNVPPSGTISTITPSGTIGFNAVATGVVNSGTGGGANLTGGGGALLQGNLTGSFAGTPVTPTFAGANLGSATPFSIVPPSLTVNYVIKVSNGTLPTVGVLSLGGMTGDITCGSNVLCNANNISVPLGTMAAQNANAVAITGGTITGMPTPTNPTDVAIKSYVDAVGNGRPPLAPVRLATTGILSNTPTYANGAAGVGRTLTAGSNGVLSIDTTAVNLNDRVLVKDQVAQLQNGCFTLTTVGTVSVAYILTGCTDADTAAEMPNGLTTLVTAGTVNTNSSWTLNQPNAITVGTTALPWVNTQASSPNFWTLSGADIHNNNAGNVTMTGNIGLGTASPTVPFESAWPNSTYSMAIGFPATFWKVYAGSPGTPITTLAPTIGISRREAMTVDTQGAQDSALYVENIGNNTSTFPAVNAQVDTLYAFARQLGSGDAVAIYGNAQQNGAVTVGTSYAAFGVNGQCGALVAGTSCIGLASAVQNGTGTNQPYTPALGRTHPNTIGVDVATIGANLHSVGVYVHSDGTAGWDVGIGFPSGISSADIRSDSSAADSFVDFGSHFHGINLVNATYSAFAILATGFTVDPSGNERALSNTATSDERLKNIHGPYAKGLTDLAKINPIRFTWLNKEGPEQAGLSAQNVQASFPEAVSADDKGMLGVNDRPLIAAAINALKELKAENEILRSCQNSWKCRLFGLR